MIPILLDNKKSLKELLLDKSNGIGRLSEIISCSVIEERNGQYDMTFRLPITAKYYDDIRNGGIVRIKVSDGSLQMFRIYKISKPMNGVVEIDAHHITYDLGKTAVAPFQSKGAINTMASLKNNLMGDYPFEITTDITNDYSNFNLDIPRAFRECLGGYQGSILDVFGGEYEWDNLTVKLHAHRGNDNGVKILYGKNLVDIKQEENIENTYNAVLGYANINETTYKGDIQFATETPTPKVQIIDFSDKFQDEETPTTEKLNQLASDYIKSNNIGSPSVSLDVEFIPLAQTEEYKDIAPLEKVSLCDTVTVQFEQLGVDSKAKVIRTEWDVINERYISLELGDTRTNLTQAIAETATQAVLPQTTSIMDSAIEHATNLITGGLGGYIVIGKNADGQPEEILIMDNPSKEQAVNVIRMNKNGIGFSTTGYNGPFRSAWTIDGKFTADNITGGTMRAGSIEGVNIKGSTISGSNVTFGNDPYVTIRTNNDGDGVLFQGTGVAKFETRGDFRIYNFDKLAKIANIMLITNGETINYINLTNYLEGVLVNSLMLNTETGIRLINYKDSEPVQRIVMDSEGTYITNRKGGSAYIWLKNDGTIDIYGSAVHIYNQQ